MKKKNKKVYENLDNYWIVTTYFVIIYYKI